MSNREQIFDEITQEREVQATKWNDDSGHTINDWHAIASIFLSKATRIDAVQHQRRHLIEAAAVIVAAIESYDANGGEFEPRHYDPSRGSHEVVDHHGKHNGLYRVHAARDRR